MTPYLQPSERPPSRFRMGPDKIQAALYMKEALEDESRPVPQWILDVAAGKDPTVGNADGSSGGRQDARPAAEPATSTLTQVGSLEPTDGSRALHEHSAPPRGSGQDDGELPPTEEVRAAAEGMVYLWRDESFRDLFGEYMREASRTTWRRLVTYCQTHFGPNYAWVQSFLRLAEDDDSRERGLRPLLRLADGQFDLDPWALRRLKVDPNPWAARYRDSHQATNIIVSPPATPATGIRGNHDDEPRHREE